MACSTLGNMCTATDLPDGTTATTSNYMTPYPTTPATSGGTLRISCLPSNAVTVSGGKITAVSNTLYDTNGNIISSALNTHIASLLTSAAATAPTSLGGNSMSQSSAEAFATKADALITGMKIEFCYYYIRYRFALCAYLTQQTTSPIVNVVPLGDVQTLNTILNMIIATMSGIKSSRNTSLTGYYDSNGGLNSLNVDLKAVSDDLAQNSAILKSHSLKSDIQSSMVDYTLEKNESSHNMLAIYGFMNIIAVSLLYYAYTSK